MFNDKLDIKLISLVKENPVLYDCNHAKYMDFNAREVAWHQIGDTLKRPAGDCKDRWINIRDVHRRILKKCLANPSSRSRTYKYETQLGFMKPFYKDVPYTPNDDEFDEDKIIWEVEVDDDDGSARAVDTDDSEKPIGKLVSKKGGRKRKKNTSYEEEDKQEVVTFTETTAADFDPADPVDAFLISIGATLKTFNAYHLNLAKSKIFAVVQEHDLQQIVQKSNEDKAPTSSQSLYNME